MHWLLLIAMLFALSGCMGPQALRDDGRVVLAEDQYYRSGFEIGRTATLSIQVEVYSGPNVDVFVMDQLNFQQFENGNDIIHFSSCGGVAAQGFQRSCTLSAGTYFIVLDNSDRGSTAPPFNGIDDPADVGWIIEWE
ncbi:MAG: hypothetical protein KY455_04070 [Euryarchaeota archaeon]|nr:hypothetical protein [Euryarchaeota archaeon]